MDSSSRRSRETLRVPARFRPKSGSRDDIEAGTPLPQEMVSFTFAGMTVARFRETFPKYDVACLAPPSLALPLIWRHRAQETHRTCEYTHG